MTGSLVSLLLGYPLWTSAGRTPSYRYADIWWEEYEPADHVVLLLHFGPPTLSSARQLAQEIARREAEKDILDLRKDMLRSALDIDPADLPDSVSSPWLEETSLPADQVLDYSGSRRRIALGVGLTRIPDGRFGGGLRCDGTGSLKVSLPAPSSVEGWIRIASYPAAEQCIFSVARGESRLLLRPDGRLELRLRRPHGHPDSERLRPEVLKAILARPTEIVSPEPIPLDTWTHVAIWAKPHPAPGNTSPFDARLTVNGRDVAWYLSEGGNRYPFMGQGTVELIIGNGPEGQEGFHGDMDEVRVCHGRAPQWIERILMPWRDATLERPLQFDRPWFRSDSTLLHVSLDRGLLPDLDRAGAGPIRLDLKGLDPASLLVDGVRGRGWILDPQIGFPTVSLKGLSLDQGSVEFWMRPVNWDDTTGYWHHSPPPQLLLSVARVTARQPQGNPQVAIDVRLPRAWNLERSRMPLDPGRWSHVMITWQHGGWHVWVDGKRCGGGTLPPERNRMEVLGIEFGVSDPVTVMRGERPKIEIDEIVVYRSALRADEVEQARRRWMGRLDPIPLFEASQQYKWSLHTLEFTLTPLLPEGVTPASAEVALYGPQDEEFPLRGPLRNDRLEDGAFRWVLHQGKPLPYGRYHFRFRIWDVSGREAAAGERTWTFEEEPWRYCRAGILNRVPPPWTPIRAAGGRLETRMSAYQLGPDGLPAQIEVEGIPLLAGPLRIEEAGARLTGQWRGEVTGDETAVSWQATFRGERCDATVQCRLEYDGMLRFEWTLQPKGRLHPLTFVIPLREDRALRYLAYAAGERGVFTGEIPKGNADPLILSSRSDRREVWSSARRDFREFQTRDPALDWDAFWAERRSRVESYGFYTHVDLNDLSRGLWWFCDHAGGWILSKRVGAVEVVRQDGTVALVLRWIAEPTEPYPTGRPIVFAVLPHPARPLPENYRRFQKPVPEAGRFTDMFDAFFPWPSDPRDHSMKVYPAADPKHPAAGPSWAYAESCLPLMQACKPQGFRTMYLSKAWFSGRAGSYDHWEWRSGPGGAVSLTPWFVNYLCWEMKEWIGRQIFDAIYLDECYEHPARNLEAGFSVLLSDGSELPGVTNFAFRELMKRWRNLFHECGREPLLMAHHTQSWQYHGLVFCDATLDGENTPIVSLRSRDWIDSTSKHRFEVLQNARLWGVATFYMPFIAEGGFDDKTRSQYRRWQWRMARQAQSQFAHYETSTVFEGQGREVYEGYWRDVLGWGAGDPAVEFVPYWATGAALTVEDQGAETLVSFYRKPSQILLIASNRRRHDITARIHLNLEALGLRSDPSVRSLDRTFDPPPGDDFWGVERATRQPLELAVNPDTMGQSREPWTDLSAELLLEGKETLQQRDRASFEPRWEGGVLVLPIRARDYRVVALE